MARAYTVKADFSANFLTLNCRAFSAQVYRAYGFGQGSSPTSLILGTGCVVERFRRLVSGLAWGSQAAYDFQNTPKP